MYELIGMLYQTVPLAVGVVVLLALSWVLWRRRRRGELLLLPAAAWFLAALDEWYMSTFQPQMNIRIDALPLFALMVFTTLPCVPMAFLRRPPTA
ncbi:hypothetical protein [Nonomuraea wenchangensis]|uniref:hypothetical protein n=1 Tax=Nonomuraea wenchangensis TaxID=568860 RepID=UPI00331E0353